MGQKDKDPQFAELPALAGEFPPPAGKYELSAANGKLSVISASDNLSFNIQDAAAVAAGWALPARSGGYVSLWLKLKDGSNKTLLMSEGYDAGLAAEYSSLGGRLAAALGLKFSEEPQAADG